MTWRDEAACRGMSTDIWYPPQGTNATAAKQICARCPVRAQCETEGRDEPRGVWGGKSPTERGGHSLHNRGEAHRLHDVAVCPSCQARWWAPKRVAIAGTIRCDTCRAEGAA